VLSRPPPRAPLFPYTTLFRSLALAAVRDGHDARGPAATVVAAGVTRAEDLDEVVVLRAQVVLHGLVRAIGVADDDRQPLFDHAIDRKSTRLNSSHVKISYAVF